MSIDDPRTTELRLRIIREKKFLRRIYDEWYGLIRTQAPEGPGAVLELGSGGGYFRETMPEAVRSEVFFCRNVDLVADGRRLPFRDGSLKAIVMTDVFHHIPDASAFLGEAVRCLRPRGRVVMVEPWVSPWSRWVYTHLHHEPFLPEAATWEFPDEGPLSAANGALPWMVLVRDRERFHARFPELVIREVRPMMPFRYLLSGGVSLRSLMPGAAYPMWNWLEACLSRFHPRLGMFALFCLERGDRPQPG